MYFARLTWMMIFWYSARKEEDHSTYIRARTKASLTTKRTRPTTGYIYRQMRMRSARDEVFGYYHNRRGRESTDNSGLGNKPLHA